MRILFGFSVIGITLLAIIVVFNAFRTRSFNPSTDLISLHYDHAPDKDDGQSTAADRTILQSMFGIDWIKDHVVVVSGAYGKNADQFNTDSNSVMDAVWKETGGWLSAHSNREMAFASLTDRWYRVLANGGHVWVKEGGQSDLTATVLKRIKERAPSLDTVQQIHVIQHSVWNERYTTEAALAFTRKYTDYIKIRDGNEYLNREGGIDQFSKAAMEHPVYGKAWKAAFNYYKPEERLDISDTGALMYILGLGEIDLEEFLVRFLSEPTSG